MFWHSIFEFKSVAMSEESTERKDDATVLKRSSESNPRGDEQGEERAFLTSCSGERSRLHQRFVSPSYPLNETLLRIHSASRHRHERSRGTKSSRRCNAARHGDSPCRRPRPANLQSDVRCAQIKTIEKLIKIKDSRIKYLQDLIEIETFDKDCLDASQLSALIKEKANTELKYASALAKNPAKKPKQDPKLQEDAIVPTKNSFTSLSIDDPADITNENEKPMIEDNPDSNGTIPENEDVTVTPKVKPIMLRYQTNYNLILKELDRKYPKAVNKLTGQYIKIMASNTDEHREITAALKAQGEEFYSVPHLSERPLKVVIKGLPKSTPTDEIKEDLLNQGVPVMKVSQLTQRKSKFPQPIFLVEVRKHVEGATDIYEISKCCYMSVVLDTFNKKPGATQCYNCNYFNHSSANCFMKPRCLKC
ncbi:uncharacterized protein TNCV_1942131 [Trichonephila clavipes]|uniref:Pre-C2HC domain-containing protein n=1 Tax=Trichonephila clavipes TaxID=2585209 RepID=A0A8X6SDG0_TRICX|nr:uncharacterized protein TNCV_1942131 [Trichonephila clavipes]